jgi:hypothetical protein
MIETLKVLHEEEMQLRATNKFLAHRAALMGCTAGLDGGTRREARRKAAAKKAVATSTGGPGGSGIRGGGGGTTTTSNSDNTPKIMGEAEQVESSVVKDPSTMEI